MHLLHNKAFINGEWVSSETAKTFEVRNPANLSLIGTVPDMTKNDCEKAIKAAKSAFETWQNTTVKERSDLLRKWLDLMAKEINELSKIITAEAGKSLGESTFEVMFGNSFVEWYSEEARRIYGEIIPSPFPGKKILVERQPLGVVGLITPWNFPYAMITRKVAAALAAGCTCVIKPAEDTPFSALALADLADKAGFPKGVINVVTSDRNNAVEIGNLLCTSNDVAGISFTGSTAVGRILYNQCAPGIKRIALELGGNAPFIVFKSADVDKAVIGAMMSKFTNCGQTCIASNRFFVQEQVYDTFLSKLTEQVKKLRLGNGVDEGVTTGPLINHRQVTKVTEMVEDAVSKGGKVHLGGKPANKYGELYFEPTILTNIKDNMRVYNEEVFGPVVTIIKFSTEEEVLKIANGTQTGLAGYFYSQDVSQIFRVSKNLEVGMVGVNDTGIVFTEAPFGGWKQSGIGREGCHHGIDEFTEVKYICIGNLV